MLRYLHSLLRATLKAAVTLRDAGLDYDDVLGDAVRVARRLRELGSIDDELVSLVESGRIDEALSRLQG